MLVAIFPLFRASMCFPERNPGRRATGAPAAALGAAHALLGVEVAQGTVGFVQYFADLPVLVVALHMLGTGLTAAAVTRLVLQVREGLPAAVEADAGRPT